MTTTEARDMTKTLLVYYSKTGNTRRVAEMIAAAGNCDIDEIVDLNQQDGLIGNLDSGLGAICGARTRLRPGAKNPADYDLVIVGTPVWMTVSVPVATYLRRHRRQFKEVAFFATTTRGAPQWAFRKMTKLAGRVPIAALAITQQDLVTGCDEEKVAGFVTAIGGIRASGGAGLVKTAS
jgi:flavodoxin